MLIRAWVVSFHSQVDGLLQHSKGGDVIAIKGCGLDDVDVFVFEPVDDEHLAPFRERAAALKRVTSVPIILVGGIRSLQTAQNVVDSGDADLVSMCRPFIREPDLIARWQRGEQWLAECISCGRCHPQKGEPVGCAEELRL